MKFKRIIKESESTDGNIIGWDYKLEYQEETHEWHKVYDRPKWILFRRPKDWLVEDKMLIRSTTPLPNSAGIMKSLYKKIFVSKSHWGGAAAGNGWFNYWKTPWLSEKDLNSILNRDGSSLADMEQKFKWEKY